MIQKKKHAFEFLLNWNTSFINLQIITVFCSGKKCDNWGECGEKKPTVYGAEMWDGSNLRVGGLMQEFMLLLEELSFLPIKFCRDK